jgi:hypothetical protein
MQQLLANKAYDALELPADNTSYYCRVYQRSKQTRKVRKQQSQQELVLIACKRIVFTVVTFKFLSSTVSAGKQVTNNTTVDALTSSSNSSSGSSTAESRVPPAPWAKNAKASKPLRWL